MNDWDRAYWVSVAFAIIGWTVAAIGVVGELLGWWNDLGETIITSGSLLGTIGTLAGLGYGAGRRQVGRVEAGVGRIETKLETIGTGVQGMRDDLSTQWDRQMLAIDRAFDEEEEQTALLEEQAAEERQQTALLEEQAALERQQTELLREIRDRL